MTTSGVDGVYPAGLAVATVASVDRQLEAGFARIVLAPAARSDAVRHVLVIEPIGLQLPPHPDTAASSGPAVAASASGAPGASAARRGTRVRTGAPAE